MPKIAGLAGAAAIILSSFAAFAAATPAFSADDDPICANRPGKGTPTCVVGAGRVQAELGIYDLVSDHNFGVNTHVYSAGDITARLGIASTTEVWAHITPYTLVRQRDRATGAQYRASGVGDLTFGVRQALIRGGAFNLSIQPYATAPTGASGISADAWSAGVVLPMSLGLTEATGLFFSPEVDWAPNASGSGHHVAYAGAIGISHAFGQISLGAELWGAVDDDPSGSITQTSADLTAAWIPKFMPSLQFDAGINAGLNKNTPDMEVYFGVSKRF